MTKEHCMIHKIDGHYKRCKRTDIAVYIMWKGEKIPLCYDHWKKIADSKREWRPK